MSSEFLDRVRTTILRHQMVAAGARVGLAVSGGADSMALLVAMAELAEAARWQLEVIHVNHRARGEASEGDAAFVGEQAARLRLPFHLAVRDVSAEAGGGNWEQAARAIRQQEFARWRAERQGDVVATAHTQSDQAETVLFRVLRGSGLRGLAGVLPVTAEGIVRPLLGVTRGEVEGFLRVRGLGWRDDATNADLARDRNRLRHQLLPQLRAEWNPRVDEALAAMARLAQGEEAFWDAEVARRAAQMARAYRDGFVVDAGLLMAEPLAVRRRLVRWWSERVCGRERPLDFDHVEAILNLAEQREGHGRLQAVGLDVFRSFDWLWLAPAGAATGGSERMFTRAVEPGSWWEWPDGERRIGLILREISSPDNLKNVDQIVDWDLLKGPLILRTWTPGDELKLRGSAGGGKIKLLFQEGRVPLWERRFWPVLESGGRVVWSRRFGAAAEVAVTGSTRRALEVVERVSPE